MQGKFAGQWPELRAGGVAGRGWVEQAPGCLSTPEGMRGLVTQILVSSVYDLISDLCYNGIHYLLASISGSQKGMFKRGLSKTLALVSPIGTYHTMPQAPSWPPCLKGFEQKQLELKLLPNINKLCSSKYKPSRKLVWIMNCHGWKVILIEKVKLIKWRFFK